MYHVAVQRTLCIGIHNFEKLNTTPCLRKKAFLLECQISTNYNKFWQEDGKMIEIVCYVGLYILHLT